MARFIRALLDEDGMAITKPLNEEDFTMKETVEMVESNEFSGFVPFSSELIYWTHWTKDRFGPNMKKFRGPDKLAILSFKTRLAKLILIQAHRKDHRRDLEDTLFRSRSDAWIVRGKADYRLDKVEKSEIDDKGLERAAWVIDDKGLVRAERHQGVDEAKASKEKSLPYCSRKLIFMNMLQVRMTYREQMLQVKAEYEAHEEQAHDEEHVQVEEQVDDEEQDLIDKLEQVN